MVTNKQKRLSKATIDHANHVAIVAIAEANGIAMLVLLDKAFAMQ